MQMYGMMNIYKIFEESGEELKPHDFELWAEPTETPPAGARRRRIPADSRRATATAATAFQGRARLDYLYGEIWTRQRYLTRRDRRIISICSAASDTIDEEVTEHLRAALALGDMTRPELEELVVHFAVYLGWNLARRLDDLLIQAAGSSASRRKSLLIKGFDVRNRGHRC